MEVVDGRSAIQLNIHHAHTYTVMSSFTEPQGYKVPIHTSIQHSDKWDLACSINNAAKSQLLNVAKSYLPV